jgi:hypothetical protein
MPQRKTRTPRPSEKVTISLSDAVQNAAPELAELCYQIAAVPAAVGWGDTVADTVSGANMRDLDVLGVDISEASIMPSGAASAESSKSLVPHALEIPDYEPRLQISPKERLQRRQDVIELLDALYASGDLEGTEEWARLKATASLEMLEGYFDGLPQEIQDEAYAAMTAAESAPEPRAETETAEEKAVREERGARRSAWLDRKISEEDWLGKDLLAESHLAYNTIKRYRAGEKSNRGSYVRGQLAKAFRCELSEVPE